MATELKIQYSKNIANISAPKNAFSEFTHEENQTMVWYMKTKLKQNKDNCYPVLERFRVQYMYLYTYST
jgi:hypothetical protein